MLTFETFILQERVINLFLVDTEDRWTYASEVFAKLKAAYAKIGGIHGSGFTSEADMVKSLPMWKLVRRDDSIVAGAFYKEKTGRKRVAVFTDGTEAGKNGLAMILKEDFQRSYGETSGPLLTFMSKLVGYDFLKKFAMDRSEVERLASPEPIQDPPEDDPDVQRHPAIANYFYQRKIGGDWHTKIMMGTPGKTLPIEPLITRL